MHNGPSQIAKMYSALHNFVKIETFLKMVMWDVPEPNNGTQLWWSLDNQLTALVTQDKADLKA